MQVELQQQQQQQQQHTQVTCVALRAVNSGENDAVHVNIS